MDCHSTRKTVTLNQSLAPPSNSNPAETAGPKQRARTEKPRAVGSDRGQLIASLLNPAMDVRDSDSVTLAIHDFDRIGLRPRESRLPIIRQAASRASRSLAMRQLCDPSIKVEKELTEVAVATYRLMDPRQRPDHRSSAHVGRIRPSDLETIAAAKFAPLNTAGPLTVDPETQKLDGVAPAQPETSETQAAVEQPTQKRWQKIRSGIQTPQAVLVFTVLLLATAAGLWFWGRHYLLQQQRQSEQLIQHRISDAL